LHSLTLPPNSEAYSLFNDEPGHQGFNTDKILKYFCPFRILWWWHFMFDIVKKLQKLLNGASLCMPLHFLLKASRRGGGQIANGNWQDADIIKVRVI